MDRFFRRTDLRLVVVSLFCQSSHSYSHMTVFLSEVLVIIIMIIRQTIAAIR
jgi:hypothetical protein